MAASDYRNSLDPFPLAGKSEITKKIKIYPLSSKMMMGGFIFGLVLALWDTRNDNRAGLIMVLGVAMNLWWVWMFATPSLRSNRP
jgi:hypothetical protein